MSNSENTPDLESQEQEQSTLSPLESVMEKIPDDVLIGEIAGRIQNEPSVEIRKIVQTSQSFSGPLPPPSMLAQYDDIEGGLADRIVKMAEEQQSHRHSLENTSVTGAINSEKRGQNYALIVSILIIIGSIGLIALGKELSGSILAGATLTGLAYIFITGRKEEENNQKGSSKRR